MRPLYALPPPYITGADGGAWVVPSCTDGRQLRIIASWGGDWDHISVSCERRCPNWAEMEQVAKIFFQEDETAMQLHVPPTEHVDLHPYCLHWWRPQKATIPRPPGHMVGPKLP